METVGIFIGGMIFGMVLLVVVAYAVVIGFQRKEHILQLITD